MAAYGLFLRQNESFRAFDIVNVWIIFNFSDGLKKIVCKLTFAVERGA